MKGRAFRWWKRDVNNLSGIGAVARGAVGVRVRGNALQVAYFFELETQDVL